jgi:hypothetical protein
LSGSERDLAAWARAHGAYFEVEPLHDVIQGRPVQVGFTINLYARLPRDGPPSERWVLAAQTRARLRQIFRLLGPEGSLEIQPPRTAVSLALGANVPEVAVSARVFLGADHFATANEPRVCAGAGRLTEIGLKERPSPLNTRSVGAKEKLHE